MASGVSTRMNPSGAAALFSNSVVKNVSEQRNRRPQSETDV